MRGGQGERVENARGYRGRDEIGSQGREWHAGGDSERNLSGMQGQEGVRETIEEEEVVTTGTEPTISHSLTCSLIQSLITQSAIH